MKNFPKLIVFAFLLLVFSFIFTTKIKAAQVPPADVDLSDKVYADLALRHDLDHVSVYYFDDNIHNTISINSEKNWVPASTVKLFVAMYAFDQAAAGNISLDQMVTIQDKNVAPSQSFPDGYGPLSAGDTVSIYELLDRMITQSGNVSYNTLLDLLDRTKITKYIHDLGLVNSSVGGKLNLNDNQEFLDSQTPGYGINITNADDYARAFILINGKRLPGSASLFDMLARQKFKSMLPALLPKNVVVAHKTGELDPYYHDGGIVVDKDRRYVLSVFSDAGDPALVAHISQLIYTGDINLIGSEIKPNLSEDNNLPPLDPIVAEGQVQESVLGEATSVQNAITSSITASDLGIKTNDLVSSFSSKDLPRVIIPVTSPLHILVDLEDKISQNLPIPGIKTSLEIENLKLKLAEANDLITKGQKNKANSILKQIDSRLANVSQESIVSSNLTLQNSIHQISVSRFSLLKGELDSSEASDKVNTIKEIANEARNTIENIEPHLQKIATYENLSQKPVIGKVVSSSLNSITVQTSDGTEIKSPIDNEVKARKADGNVIENEKITQIPLGSVIALAGIDQETKKPSFVLTNISSSSSQLQPTKVIKVDPNENTIIVTDNKGIPVQVDLNKSTVIKGNDTEISLNQLKKGDTIVVQGKQISPAENQQNPSSSASPSVSPITTNTSTPASTSSTSSTSTTTSTAPNLPVASGKPSSSSSPANNANQPQVIQGSVIKVINRTEEKKSPQAPKPQTPAPQPVKKEDKKTPEPKPSPNEKVH